MTSPKLYNTKLPSLGNRVKKEIVKEKHFNEGKSNIRTASHQRLLKRAKSNSECYQTQIINQKFCALH